MTDPNVDWDDTRLDAAFRARFDANAPSGLLDGIASDLEAPKAIGWWTSVRTSTATLAAAALVVAVVVVGSQLGTRTPLPGASTSATGTPNFTSPALGQGSVFPSMVVLTSLGQTLDVISVAEAANIRDSGVDPVVIAVGGWYVPWQPIPCPLQPDEFQILEGCYLNSSWLLDSPDALFQRGPSGPAPALHPVTSFDTPGLEGQPPEPVVFIGHFDDARASECPAGPRRQSCADRFVVDQVAWTGKALGAQFPTTAADLQVITVDLAISSREMGLATELAVEGWYRSPLPGGCLNPPELVVPLLQGGPCEAIDDTWLMAKPDADVSRGRAADSAFNVTFGGIWPPDVEPIPATSGSARTPVVFIGHFHDRRSSLCPVSEAAACGRRFVVDAVPWLDGATQSVPVKIDWRDGGQPQQTQAQTDAISRFLADHPWVVNTRLASSSSVLNLEPALARDRVGEPPVPPALRNDPLLWLATVIEPNPGPFGPVARTWIIDSHGVVYVDGGSTFVIAGPTPT